MLQTSSGAKGFEPLLVNLNRVEGMRGIRSENGEVRIGALATITDLLKDEMLRRTAPILPYTAERFACGQVRNSATIGGNICNASPAGDMMIPLLLLDAEVEVAGWADGKATSHRSPLCEFFERPGKTKLLPSEILTAVLFPVPSPDFVARFEKFGTRRSMDISVVSVGIGGRLSDGKLTDARVAFGAVAPVPKRGRETEAVLEGQSVREATIASAVEKAESEISPISDVRGSAWYRRELVKTLTGRLLRDVVQTGD